MLIEVATREFREVDEEWVDKSAGDVPDDYGLKLCEWDVTAMHHPKRYKDHSAGVVLIMNIISCVNNKMVRLTRASSYRVSKRSTTQMLAGQHRSYTPVQIY